MAKSQGAFIKYARVQAKKHPGTTDEDISSFFEHMSTLLNSGVPLLRALVLAGEQTESSQFQKILKEVAKKVSGGSSFFEAISVYPKQFPNQTAQIIRTGELSGQLAPLLVKLNESLKKSAAIRGKVKSALIYPSIMLCVAVAAIFIMLWKVIPTFAQFFQDFGKKLPPITQFILDSSDFVQHHGIAMVVSTAVGIFVFKKFIATDFGARQFYSLAMALPVVGELVIQSAMEKFSSNMALLMKSGMPLLDSLHSVEQSFSANPIYHDALDEIHRKVSTGTDLGSAMQATNIFTSLTVGMVKMGEESGKLSEVLEVIADHYSEKVAVLTLRLTGLMEPVIVIGMGVVVAGMLASVYLPMFQLSGATG